MLGALLVITPLELGWVWQQTRGPGRRRALESLGIRRPRRTDLLPFLLLGPAAVILPGLVTWAETPVKVALWHWVPDSLTVGFPVAGGLSSPVLAATVVLCVTTLVVLGPAVEEAYFRGWLLPRAPGGPVLSCVAATVCSPSTTCGSRTPG